MIVVDTNIIGYLYLTGERSHQAERALLKEPGWAAPVLWRSEFQSVLALYLRRKLMELPDAQQIMDEATGLMRGREYEVVSSEVLRLAAASACSAHDCVFVALAQDLDLPLVTVDRQVLHQFPDRAVSLEAFAG